MQSDTDRKGIRSTRRPRLDVDIGPESNELAIVQRSKDARGVEGVRDRLAPDGSKTVAQEFGEGLPEIGERQHAGEALINRDTRKDIQSIQPLPTIPLPRRSLQCASLPVASFEAPLSCLRADPKHQGLRRSARAAELPSRYNRSAAHQSR